MADKDHGVAAAQSKTKLRTTVVPNLVLTGNYDQAEISPDGSVLALSNSTGIQIWDIATSKLLRTLRYFAYFNQFHFLPDGATIVSVQKDGTIKFWNIETGANIATLAGANPPPQGEDPTPVFAMAIDKQGKLLVSGSADGEVRIWNLAKRQLVRKFKAPGDDEFKILALRVSDDGARIVATSFSRMIIFDSKSGHVISSFKPNEKYFFANDDMGASIAGDNAFIVSAQQECSALSYIQLNSAGKPEQPVPFYTPVCSEKDKDAISRSPHVLRMSDGKILVSDGDRGVLRVWDPSTRHDGQSLGWTPKQGAQALAFSPDGRDVVISENDSLRMYDLNTGAIKREFRQESIDASGLISSPSHEFVSFYDARPDGATTRLDSRVWKVRSISPSKVEIAIEGPYDREQQSLYELTNDGASTLRSNDGNEIVLNSTADGHELRRIPIQGTAGISDARLSPDGKFLLVKAFLEKSDASADAPALEAALLVDAKTGAVLVKRSPTEAEANVAAFFFSADSRLAIVSFWNGTAAIWNTNTLQLVGNLQYDESVDSAIFSMAISNDGKYLVGGQRDTGVSIWDMATGKLVRNYQFDVIAGHVNVECVAISHDGKLIAGGLTERALSSGDIGRERGVKVWDVKTGKLVYSLEDHDMGVASVAFSDDDRYIISASFDGTVRYWDRSTGKWLATSASARDGKWLTITESGFYAASEGNTDLVNVVRGLQPYFVAQFQDHLFRPDLVEALLKGDPEGKYADAASKLNLDKILDSGSAPQIDEIPGRKTELTGDKAKIAVRLTDTGGGIGDKIVWRVNGVTQGAVGLSEPAPPPATTRGGYKIAIETLRLDPSKKNIVEVTAYNKAGLLATEPYRIEIDKFGVTSEERPRMYVLAVGVSNYAKAEWQLKYAADDARTVAETLKGVAKGLYGEPKIIPLLDKDATAKGIEAAIDSLKDTVKPADVFVLYIAGHGRSIAGTYYFLPQDLTFDGGQTIMSGGVSQDMLQAWLAKIPAQKSILILDTCESAAARGNDVEQETAIDRLQHATGRSVITAASSSAFEGYKDHGLLTYVILDELTRPSEGMGGNEVTLWKLATYVKEQVPRISQEVFGERQEPHNSVGDDFPIGERIGALANTGAGSEIPKTPTHVVIRKYVVRELPSANAPGSRELAPGTQVRVVEFSGDWVVIARDGQKLGYVPADTLALIQ